MNETAKDSKEAPAPSVCPFCRSTHIMAPTSKVSASSYWRCESCGQMWNVERQLASQRAPRWNRGYGQ